jgi:hypothetical protein
MKIKRIQNNEVYVGDGKWQRERITGLCETLAELPAGNCAKIKTLKPVSKKGV